MEVVPYSSVLSVDSLTARSIEFLQFLARNVCQPIRPSVARPLDFIGTKVRRRRRTP